MPELAFSVSACSREKRENEIQGEDYYFLGVKGFKKKIAEKLNLIQYILRVFYVN